MFAMKKRLLPFMLLLSFSCTVAAQVWSPKAIGVLPANYNVADICIVNEQVIWAVAFDWQPLLNNQPIPASAIPKVLKSTDGGATWSVKDIEEAMGRVSYDIHAFDENTACITTQSFSTNPGRGIFRTTDGGENWTETYHNAAGGMMLHFFDAQEGVCWNWGWGGKGIARTNDGGATWTLVPTAMVPSPMANEGHTFSSASNAYGKLGDRIWFGTTKGRILKTEDRGKTWDIYNTNLGVQSALKSMGFMDEKNGVAVSWFQNDSTQEIVRTTDGGLNWDRSGNLGFDEVDVIPCSKTFIAVTYWIDPKTSVSTDFGQTWTKVDSTIDAAGVVFNSPEFGWMIEAEKAGVGAGPALYKWTGGTLDTRIYVDKNATGANTGVSWADAYTDLKTALTAAQAGDEIWVAEGVYKPAALGGGQTATFLIDKDLKLYGGFAGTECNLSERDIALHPTMLSGDLNGDDVDSSLTQNRGDNVLHVLRIGPAITNAGLLDGFTIRGGHADGVLADERRGGGLLCQGKPLLQHCVFEQNYALGNGGGIAMNNTSNGFAIESCTFRYNSGNEGGGLVISSTQFTVQNCRFVGNSAHSGILEANGGGIFVTDPNPGTIRNCHFSENRAADAGAGLYAWTTASSTVASLLVSGCTFENNTTPNYGAALCLVPWGDNTNFAVDRCHFQANQANDGGALLLYVNSNANNASVLLDSSTFSQNHAENNGGAIFMQAEGNMNLEINRSQFTENTAVRECGATNFWSTNGGTGTLTVDSCLFEKNSAFWAGALEMGSGHGNIVTQINYFLTNSVVQNNHASDQAGGILLWSDQKAKANFHVENCLIQGNSSEGRGGGIAFAPTSTDYHATISRTRIVGNESASSGGAALIDFEVFQNVPFPANASVLFENCLIAGNTSADAGIAADSLPNLKFLNCTIADNQGNGIQLSDRSSLTLQNTILYNPGFTEYTAATPDVSVASLGGNLIGDGSLGGNALSYDLQNADPLFVGAGDYHLAANSPGIDKGVDFGKLPDLDLDGKARINGCVDIGAYESAVLVSTECVTGNDEAVAVGVLIVSPNPAGDALNVQLPDNFTTTPVVLVFDMQGRKVLHGTLPAGHALDVRSLPPGVYALKAVAGERVYAGKFVKQ